MTCLGSAGSLAPRCAYNICICKLQFQGISPGPSKSKASVQGLLEEKKKKRKKGSDSSVNFSKSKELFRKTEGTQSWGTNLQSALNSRLDMINSGVSVLKTKL